MFVLSTLDLKPTQETLVMDAFYHTAAQFQPRPRDELQHESLTEPDPGGQSRTNVGPSGHIRQSGLFRTRAGPRSGPEPDPGSGPEAGLISQTRTRGRTHIRTRAGLMSGPEPDPGRDQNRTSPKPQSDRHNQDQSRTNVRTRAGPRSGPDGP
ncbi:hypothetical protein WMY93_033908 [Mugilogobius chulae]|uniref:Uncharacterized protein n=1 Tax=Mugilogobius chulae TaxID=88201 RepID=A0AAW0MR93_9GOBI